VARGVGCVVVSLDVRQLPALDAPAQPAQEGGGAVITMVITGSRQLHDECSTERTLPVYRLTTDAVHNWFKERLTHTNEAALT
jgi:hypothetical protein